MEFTIGTHTIWIDKKNDESEDIFMLRCAFIIHYLNAKTNHSMIELVRYSEMFVNMYVYNNTYNETITSILRHGMTSEYIKFMISQIKTTCYAEY